MEECNSRCTGPRGAAEQCGGVDRLQLYHFEGTLNLPRAT